LAETYFGDHLAANTIVLGAAYQAGLVPVSGEAIERAIALNGVAVRMNTDAFRLGRRVVAGADVQPQPAQSQHPNPHATAAEDSRARELIASMGDRYPLGDELRRLLEIRVLELIAYQNVVYARQYIAFVAQVYAAEQAAMPSQTGLSEAVARYLFKLMAYKDEYEVARLHLMSGLDQSLAEQFGADARIRYLLHPPLLRAMGWQKKIELGRWFDVVYRILMRMKVLRGTPFDIFGYAAVRRVERALVGEYRALVEQALKGLSPDTYERAVALAQLPDMIRGYEQVKLGNVRRFREAVQKLSGASSDPV
jgi:indolepyruvate ferredoxin oxidoreductase